MEMTVLAEGHTKGQRKKRLWGLSLLINNEVMFDAFGDADYLLRRMKEKGIKHGQIKKLIISHLHWDHTAGIGAVAGKAKGITVYIPEKDSDISAVCAANRCKAAISCGVQKFRFFTLTESLKTGLGGKNFSEQSAVFETPKGRVLIAGCSHPGISKIVKNASAGGGIYAIAGGLHMKEMKEQDVMREAQELKKLGIKRIIAGHCTGRRASAVMRRVFGKGFETLKEGRTFYF